LTYRLLDDTYTVDEIEDILEDINGVVEVEVESELMAAAHTNVLLLQQVFKQAQKWHLNLDADLAELENR
jgi:leucine zipper transcription factor-like protein 1